MRAREAAYVLIQADARRIPLAAECVQCVVTSPPYFAVRDYGLSAQIGLESTLAEYVAQLVRAFREVWRVLRGDGTLWVNIGDTYNAYNGNAGPASKLSRGRHDDARPDVRGHSLLSKAFKPKDRLGVPHSLVFALRADGWFFRDECVWSKPAPMPESVTDRCTKAHEFVFMLSKSERYFYDQAATKEGKTRNPAQRIVGRGFGKEIGKGLAPQRSNVNGFPTTDRNPRSVWTINTQGFPGAHFATMPPELARRCIAAGSPAGGLVLDPFNGAGTTGLVAVGLGRRYVGTDISADYLAMSARRIARPHARIPRPETDSDALPLFSGKAAL